VACYYSVQVSHILIVQFGQAIGVWKAENFLQVFPFIGVQFFRLILDDPCIYVISAVIFSCLSCLKVC
jgi:hypothetical protein